jgi:ABC-2 type transport system ATP-binding protein
MPMLEARHLRKSYNGTVAVDDVSFCIDPGEIFGLLGPNGAGKSTTINMIALLLRPDAGDIRVGDVCSRESFAYKRRVGFVPQEISLAERLTARENLRLIGRLYDLGGRVLRRRVEEALASVGLTDRADDWVSAFSGGMKRRLNIAAALLHEPSLVLMDEPTAGVDPQARVYIFDIVRRLAKEGRAVLYTTHYMEEAQRLCHRIAIIDHGKILVSGTLKELVGRIDTPRDLVLEAPGITGEAAKQIADALHGAAWVLNGDIVHFNVADGVDALVIAANAAQRAGVHPAAISMNEPTLETVFLRLTGRGLRE